MPAFAGSNRALIDRAASSVEPFVIAIMLPIPAERPSPGPLKPLASARTAFTRTPAGALVLTIDHDVVRGVTPAMLVWWFEHLGETMEFQGRTYPRYLLWHPRDHIHWELARRSAAGGTGQGAWFRIVEAFGAHHEHYVDSTEYVEKLDEEGISLVRRMAGMEVFRLEHRFRPVEGGTEYRSRMVVGSSTPFVGAAFNRWVRPRFLSDDAARAWLKHNVEEVGLLEHLLPPLYGQAVPSASELPVPPAGDDPFPSMKWDEDRWTAHVRLPGWAGFQARLGPYAGLSGDEPSDGTVELSVELEDQEQRPPTPAQAAAYRHLVTNEAALTRAILQAVFDEYPRYRESYWDALDEPEELFPPVASPEGLKPLIGLATVHVLPDQKDGLAYVGFELGCVWDDEHGLGVMTHGGRILEVGQADTSFDAWIARRDGADPP